MGADVDAEAAASHRFLGRSYDPVQCARPDPGRDREIVIGIRARGGGSSRSGADFNSPMARRWMRSSPDGVRGVEDDPRTIGHAAPMRWGRWCRLGQAGLPVRRPRMRAAEPDGRAAGVVVHVVADADVLDAEPDPAMNGETARSRRRQSARGRPVASSPVTEASSRRRCWPNSSARGRRCGICAGRATSPSPATGPRGVG